MVTLASLSLSVASLQSASPLRKPTFEVLVQARGFISSRLFSKVLMLVCS